MTTPWDSPSSEEPVMPSVEVVTKPALSTFSITSEEFTAFKLGEREGMSVVAQINDGEHETDYSVSFLRGLDIYEQPVTVQFETDDQLKARLHAKVLEDVNSELKQKSLKNRF